MFTVVAKTGDHSRFLSGVQLTGALVKAGQVMPAVLPGRCYELWSRIQPSDPDFIHFLEALGQPGEWDVRALPLLSVD